MSDFLLTELRRITSSPQIREYQDCTAEQVAEAISRLCDEVLLKDPEEGERFCNWEDDIRGVICKVTNNHVWTFDHCGYWGHQYCDRCHAAKYPALHAKRCREAIESIGRITEAEYVASLQSPKEQP